MFKATTFFQRKVQNHAMGGQISFKFYQKYIARSSRICTKTGGHSDCVCDFSNEWRFLNINFRTLLNGDWRRLSPPLSWRSNVLVTYKWPDLVILWPVSVLWRLNLAVFEKEYGHYKIFVTGDLVVFLGILVTFTPEWPDLVVIWPSTTTTVSAFRCCFWLLELDLRRHFDILRLAFLEWPNLVNYLTNFTRFGNKIH